MQTHARFPEVDPGKGHYESFYIKASRPGGGLGIWIRYTVHKRPGAEPTGSVWVTLFDAEAGAPLATKLTVPAAELSAGDGAYIAIDGARLDPERATGSIATETLDASWDLAFEGSDDPFFHLPRGWMYRAPLPKTKLLSPHPNVRYSGVFKAGDRTIELDGWPGMIGHNWGAEHAERWIWMHGAGFDDASEPTHLDVALGRVKIGPVTTPWIANGRLVLEGVEHRLGGPGRARKTEVRESPTGAELTLPGAELTVRCKVGADARKFVGWIYADPDGGEHNTLNCSIADMDLVVQRRRPDRTLRLSGGAAYEIGMRETDHGIPIQPFADG